MRNATNFTLHLCLTVFAMWLCIAHVVLMAVNYQLYWHSFNTGICESMYAGRSVMASLAALASAWIVYRMFSHAHRYGRNVVIEYYRREQQAAALARALDNGFERALSDGHKSHGRRSA